MRANDPTADAEATRQVLGLVCKVVDQVDLNLAVDALPQAVESAVNIAEPSADGDNPT